MRIVSLLPSATEIVYSLGLGDDLVGVTYECDHPAAARTKPVVSDTALVLEPGMAAAEIDRQVSERVAAGEALYRLDTVRIGDLEPDLIITQDLCRVCAVPSGQVEDALDELGCRAEVVSMDPQSLDGILESFLDVGKATGTETRAQELVASLRERIDAVRARATRLPRIRTLALEWLDPPFVGGHWIPEMVQLAAGENLLNEPKHRSRTVTWRNIADAGPEVVAFMPCGYYLPEAEEEAGRLYDVPEFKETTARAEGTVYATDASSFFSRPGPRIVEGLEILAWAIHPDTFPKPPAGTISRVSGP
jgi:iron complex transport system substrate-binding protein